MAFKLTRAQISLRADLHRRLDIAAERVSDAIVAYNDLLGDVRAFAESVAGEAQDEFSVRSEHWQESRRGEAAQAWIDAYQDADFVDLDEPDFHTDALGELPEAAE